MIMSLCMRWLYVVMLCGLRIMTWWLEPRDCHLNVNIVEIGYRWRWQDVHGRPDQEVYKVMAMFLKQLPRQWNFGRHVVSIGDWKWSWRTPDTQGYTISCYYELPEMFIPVLFAPFWLRSSQLLGWSLTVNIKLKGALSSVATVYNM
jgi:hypothetical protein